ncbi:MAG: LysM peptidoglycan-binding domain-containing protein [Anaerolineales bacterium]
MRKSISVLLACTALLLGACTRSATGSSLPTATEDPLSSLFNTIATQTALAAGAKDPDLAPTLPSATSLFGATATIAPSATKIATATTTPAPITEFDVPSSYTLHQGEHPYCLARRFNIDPSAILAANNLTESEAGNLSVGATLAIPVAEVGSFGSDRALRAHPATYTAGSNDTFYSIACAFGDVWPENIAEANGMDVDDALQAGQTLHIP